jgi:Putative peptidoglycan binding domain
MDGLLTIRSQGEDVRTLTRLLVERGYLTVETTVFDSRVRSAVEEFQARHVDSRGHPLQVDGKVGELTWWALRHADNTEILSTPVDVKFVTLSPGGSPGGRAALEAAIQEMSSGAREIGANNSGPWVEKYLNAILSPPANWCAGFVSWCFSQIPGGIPFRYSLGARDIRKQFHRKGWIYDPKTQSPEPGDIIVWWR